LSPNRHGLSSFSIFQFEKPMKLSCFLRELVQRGFQALSTGYDPREPRFHEREDRPPKGAPTAASAEVSPPPAPLPFLTMRAKTPVRSGGSAPAKSGVDRENGMRRLVRRLTMKIHGSDDQGWHERLKAEHHSDGVFDENRGC
jgi:hypothetical protein